jgi:hypothetical protein
MSEFNLYTSKVLSVEDRAKLQEDVSSAALVTGFKIGVRAAARGAIVGLAIGGVVAMIAYAAGQSPDSV